MLLWCCKWGQIHWGLKNNVIRLHVWHSRRDFTRVETGIFLSLIIEKQLVFYLRNAGWSGNWKTPPFLYKNTQKEIHVIEKWKKERGTFVLLGDSISGIGGVFVGDPHWRRQRAMPSQAKPSLYHRFFGTLSIKQKTTDSEWGGSSSTLSSHPYLLLLKNCKTTSATPSLSYKHRRDTKTHTHTNTTTPTKETQKLIWEITEKTISPLPFSTQNN